MKNWILLPLVCALLASCSTVPFAKKAPVPPSVPAVEVPRTYSAFLASPNYPSTSQSFRNEEVLARTTAENSSIRISLSLQRAFLMNGDEVALDYAVSTGKTSHPTPAGSYQILERIQDKRSNLYGKVYDAAGKVVNSSADARKAKIPPGGKFLGASMPYWMRLTWTGIGMHVGEVPRYPASHACIRGQSHIVPLVFSKTKKGTPVQIVE